MQKPFFFGIELPIHFKMLKTVSCSQSFKMILQQLQIFAAVESKTARSEKRQEFFLDALSNGSFKNQFSSVCFASFVHFL